MAKEGGTNDVSAAWVYSCISSYSFVIFLIKSTYSSWIDFSPLGHFLKSKGWAGGAKEQNNYPKQKRNIDEFKLKWSKKGEFSFTVFKEDSLFYVAMKWCFIYKSHFMVICTLNLRVLVR